MAEGTFATAINCMDGRVQIPVTEYLKEKFGVDYVDMITETGPIKYLAENTDSDKIESVRKRVELSVVNHDSKIVAIVGHADCVGNPAERETQIEQINKSVDLAKSWGFSVQFLNLFVDFTNKRWEVEEI